MTYLRYFLRLSGIRCQNWSSGRKSVSCTVIRLICIMGDTHHTCVTFHLWLPLQFVVRNKNFQGMTLLGHSICMFQDKTSKTPLARSLLTHKKAQSNLLEVDICITDVNIQPKNPTQSRPLLSDIIYKLRRKKCLVDNDTLICFQYSVY